jgi:hypothetical protein
MSDDEMEVGRAIAEDNLNEKTRKKYKRGANGFAKYVKAKFPDQWDGEKDDIKWADLGSRELHSFFAHVSKKRKRGPLSDEVVPAKLSSFDHINGFKSAILFSFKERNIQVSPDNLRLLQDIMKGWKRRVAQAKQDGELPIRDGKADIKPRVYKFLAAAAVAADCDFQQSIFAWAFLTLSWNALGRSASIGEILFSHLGWATDSLTLVFPTHKVGSPPPPATRKQ